MSINDFRKMLENVDRSYDDFVSSVISYVRIPGNENVMDEIILYIESNPLANSADVLKFMLRDVRSKDVSETLLDAVI